MAASARYFDLVREMKNAYNHRLRLVESARQRGIKPTARLFATTVPTVRKWLRRYQQQGPSGLLELSRAPHLQPRKTPPPLEQQLVALRKSLPTFGARRLIRECDLPISHRALDRIWRAHGLLKKRRRKYQRKQDLAHIKATWALFQQISADTKDLDDIPHYWTQAQRFGLPVIQYTARDVRSGLLFWAFAQQRSATLSAVFAARIQQHLDRYGVSLRDLVGQTDNGCEFKGDFPAALGDSQHVRIPPAAHTYQSDVEIVHRLEEDEFFDLEDFTSRGDFLAKVHTYQLYFNLVRLNSHKENQSPWQIIKRLAPRSSLELCLLPPVFLDYYLNDSGGYDVPRLPYYVRHGTTTLFAACDPITGTVLSQCKRRHRHQEFLDFLRHVDASVPKTFAVHLIVDNYATHKHPRVQRWLAARPRYHVHFTPTYSSWLNQVEIWFNIITQKAIRRGTFGSVKELVAKIESFVHRYNADARPFSWTATPDSILEKIQRLCERISGTQH